VRVTAVLRAADRTTAAVPLLLRMTAALLWLSNVWWKEPLDFGRTAGGCEGLCRFVHYGVEHPVAPGYRWFLREIVEPNLAVFGWGVLLVEVLLAAMLLSGTFTRGAALLGLLQSIAIGLSVANAPHEWYWSYALMAALHMALFAFAAGRTHGVDGLIRAAYPRRPVWLELLT
jgi:thiosulfate dehydrogenase [quinone] large subunit